MHADINDIILKFADNLLLNLEKPAQWFTSHIQSIRKAGYMSKNRNYRVIVLFSIAAKITNKMQ